MMALHESFGKILGSFEYRTSFGRTNHGYTLGALISLQFVVDSFDQRILRPYYHHVDAFLYDKTFDGLEVIGFHRDIFSTIHCTSISWSNVQFLAFCTLGDLPCQCMLASATS